MRHVLKWSKNNILYLILLLLIGTLTVLLFVKEEKELIIISRNYPYSIYHTDNYETIDIEILTNLKDSYHFEQSYINSSRLIGKENECSVDIKEIITSNHKVHLQSEDYYQVTFKLLIPFESNDYYLEMEDVNLELIYDNSERISFDIGEISYLFMETYPSYLSLSNLSATHQEVNGYNTIGGINIDLSNNSDTNIVITDIKILSQSVFVNKELIQINKTCEYQSTVKDCIGQDTYNFHQEYQDDVLSLLVGKNNTLELYIPLLYKDRSTFIYEFSIEIEYRINNQNEVLIIDNFPYMKSSIFTTLNEDDFNVYKFDTFR